MTTLPEPVNKASRLAQMIYCYRSEEGISIRGMASKIGINYLALMRLENGDDISSTNMAKIIAWIFRNE